MNVLRIAVAALACLLVPILSSTAEPTVTPDPQALALLQKVAAATHATHSLTADSERISHYHNPEREMRDVATIKLMKPNYARTNQWILAKSKQTGQWEKHGNPMIHASDGKSTWLVFFGGEYQQDKADKHGKNVGPSVLPTYDFFDPQQSVLAQVKEQQKKHQLLALSYAGTETWEGRPYQVVEWDYKPDYDFGDVAKKAPGGVVTEKDRLYIGADDLVYRVTEAYNVGWDIENNLRNVRVDASLTAADFHFTLPPGAHLPKPPPLLLAKGIVAPDFTIQDRDGKPVKLSDYKGKVVVLDFWATWCGPCQASLPHTNTVARQFAGKNVVVLAVNVWDKPDAFQAWLPQHKEYNALVFAIDPTGNDKDIATTLYNVSGIPTQYVIDSSGKIARSFVGYDRPTDDLANAIKAAGGT